MKQKRMVMTILLLLLLSGHVMWAHAAQGQSSFSTVSITFHKKPVSVDNDSSGTDRPDTDINRVTQSGDTVLILDPRTPTTALGDLPKTGGNYLIPLHMICCGIWCVTFFCVKQTKGGAW